MIIAIICWTLAQSPTQSHAARQGVALVKVDQTLEQVENALGAATVSTTAGAIGNLSVVRIYAKSGLMIWFGPDGKVTKVVQTTK